MAQHYDVIVVGLGAMGSAAAQQLASRGLKVLGLDRFVPPHDLGSSHGQTRIIREAYAEHPDYVPLVQRAYELWSALEAETGRELVNLTGGLMLGRPDGSMVTGILASARQHGLPYQLLAVDEVTERFPVMQPATDMVAVWEPRAGVVFCEQAVAAQLGLAAKQGAELLFGDAVVRWSATAHGVIVQTDHERYEAGAMILAAGAWMPQLAADLALPLTVERQVLHWFSPRDRAAEFRVGACPVYIWQYADDDWFYGFPNFGDGVKVAFYRVPEVVDPDAVDRTVAPAEVQRLRDVADQYMPALCGRHRRAAVCLYTMAPDGHFLLGPHPLHTNVFVASPCSGHGFKFSPAIGEALADLVVGQAPRCDLSLFAVGRFGGAASRRSAS